MLLAQWVSGTSRSRAGWCCCSSPIVAPPAVAFPAVSPSPPPEVPLSPLPAVAPPTEMLLKQQGQNQHIHMEM